MMFPKKRSQAWLVGAGIVMSLVLIISPAFAVPVDLELSLVVDSSGSIDSAEYALQLGGYANAFRNNAIRSAILGGTNGAIAVNIVAFSSSALEVIPFTLLDSAANIDIFADAIENIVRPFDGGTNIFAGINLAVPLFGDETGGIANGFESSRQVLDVSGDGTSSISSTQNARDAALNAGIDTINGLTIEGQVIENFYRNNVIGGTGAFVIGVDTFDQFSDAIRDKLQAEIINNPIPEPATILLFGTGFAGLVAWRMRKRK